MKPLQLRCFGDQTMFHPSCKVSRYATQQPCTRVKGKVFGSILLSLVILNTTTARTAEPPGKYQGVLDGAPYVIVVPPEWNGGLVMFAHGYQGEGSGGGVAFPEPLDNYLMKHGYAWASSGYRSKGYRPDLFLLDLLALCGVSLPNAEPSVTRRCSGRPRPPRYCRSSTAHPAFSWRCLMRFSKRRSAYAAPSSAS